MQSFVNRCSKNFSMTEATKNEDGAKKETEFTPLEKEEIDALRAFAMGM